MAKKYFGTDGIRGVAGRPPLDDATVYAVGAALAGSFEKSAQAPRVLIGMDTRESGPGIAALLAGGLRQTGAEVDFAGVVTTPAVAYLTQQGPYAAGVMVSASHNPYQDNGIKIFGEAGYKLPDAVEARIEAAIEEQSERGGELRAAPTRPRRDRARSLPRPLSRPVAGALGAARARRLRQRRRFRSRSPAF